MDYQKIYDAAEKIFCDIASADPQPKTIQGIAAPFVSAIIAALKEQESQESK